MSLNKVINKHIYNECSVQVIDEILNKHKEDMTISMNTAKKTMHDRVHDEDFYCLSYDRVNEAVEEMKKKKYYEITDDYIKLKRVPYMYKSHKFNEKLNDNVALINLFKISIITAGFISLAIYTANNPGFAYYDGEKFVIDDTAYDLDDLYIVSVNTDHYLGTNVCTKIEIDEDDYMYQEAYSDRIIYSTETDDESGLIKVVDSSSKNFVRKLKRQFISQQY